MQQPDQTPGRPPARGALYVAALVWAVACLALYGWQLIGIALG